MIHSGGNLSYHQELSDGNLSQNDQARLKNYLSMHQKNQKIKLIKFSNSNHGGKTKNIKYLQSQQIERGD